MALSKIQFEAVNSKLGEALLGIRRSKIVDEGTTFNAVMAKEELSRPDRDYSIDPARIINPLALNSLSSFFHGQIDAYSNWFGTINNLWRQLEDIRVAFVFERGQFDQVFGSLESDLLDGLAEIFSRFGETLSPSMLTNESGQVYRRVLLNQGNRTFPEIAQCCRDLAVRKRSARNN